MNAWQADDVLWLEELDHFASYLPDEEDFFLSSLDAGVTSDAVRGRITATGYAATKETVMRVNSQMLQARKRYRVIPHGIRATPRYEKFPLRFELEALIRTPDHTSTTESPLERFPDDFADDDEEVLEQ